MDDPERYGETTLEMLRCPDGEYVRYSEWQKQYRRIAELETDYAAAVSEAEEEMRAYNKERDEVERRDQRIAELEKRHRKLAHLAVSVWGTPDKQSVEDVSRFAQKCLDELHARDAKEADDE